MPFVRSRCTQVIHTKLADAMPHTSEAQLESHSIGTLCGKMAKALFLPAIYLNLAHLRCRWFPCLLFLLSQQSCTVQLVRISRFSECQPHTQDSRKPRAGLIIRRSKGQGRDKKAEAHTHTFWTVLQTHAWTGYSVHKRCTISSFSRHAGRKGTYHTLRTCGPSIHDFWLLKSPLDQAQKKAYVN